MSSVNDLRVFQSKHIENILSLSEPICQELSSLVEEMDSFYTRKLPTASFVEIFAFFRLYKKMEEPLSFYTHQIQSIYDLTKIPSGEAHRKGAFATLCKECSSISQKVDSLFKNYRSTLQNIACSADWRLFEEDQTQNQTLDKGFFGKIYDKFTYGKETVSSWVGVTTFFDKSYQEYLKKITQDPKDSFFIPLKQYRETLSKELDEISELVNQSFHLIKESTKKFLDLSFDTYCGLIGDNQVNGYFTINSSKRITASCIIVDTILVPYSELKKFIEIFIYHLNLLTSNLSEEKNQKLYDLFKEISKNLAEIEAKWNPILYELRYIENRHHHFEWTKNKISSYSFEMEYNELLERQIKDSETNQHPLLLEDAFHILRAPLLSEPEEENEESDSDTQFCDFILNASFEKINEVNKIVQSYKDQFTDEEIDYFLKKVKNPKDLFIPGKIKSFLTQHPLPKKETTEDQKDHQKKRKLLRANSVRKLFSHIPLKLVDRKQHQGEEYKG